MVLRKKRKVSADRRGLMSMLRLALANRKEMQEPWSSQLTPEQNCRAVKSPRTEGRDTCLQTASLHPWSLAEGGREEGAIWLASALALELALKFRGNLGKVSGTTFSLLPLSGHPRAEPGEQALALTPFPPYSWSQAHQGGGLAPK